MKYPISEMKCKVEMMKKFPFSALTFLLLMALLYRITPTFATYKLSLAAAHLLWRRLAPLSFSLNKFLHLSASEAYSY
jgi:hypothetical protein